MELPRTPLPCTGVKIASASAYFHGFGVARQGPWITRVNRLPTEHHVIVPTRISGWR
jgi:hypothetical protein